MGNFNGAKKTIALFLAAVSLAACFGLPAVFAAYAKIGDNELRGAWIATVLNINFPSKPGLSADQMRAELDSIVKNCKEANLNAIFFQARPAGDAFYNSEYFPTSKYLTGKQGDPLPKGFDPLGYIIEIAHKNNIELHAWINPYRIASDTMDLSALAASNPARKNPSWAVAYNGALFYNPGLPEVRELITAGVIEIVKNYDVDGIHFDDYFYPYPDGKGTAFDDAAAYGKYGSGYRSVDDFRRASVNELVKSVHSAIKKEKPGVRFGIAPFGIWANKSEKTPAGSATKGFESYYSIYSDSKAWVNGGYIDYICPQIYWAFDTAVAPFDVLVNWWSAVVDGTGVDLYIGHAAYKVPTDFKSETEIPRQVEYARSYMGVSGSVFYGYSNIAANDYKLKDSLAKMFASPLKIPKPVSNGAGISFGRPASGSTVTEASVNIMGNSDPAYPVYYEGEKLARSKSGSFSVYVSLKDGKNEITFTQNNKNYINSLTKGKIAMPPPSVATHAQMDSYKIEIVSPDSSLVARPGDKIAVSVKAPSKSSVTAKLGNASVALRPQINPPDEGDYMAEIYSGIIELPNTQPQGEPINLGGIAYAATRGALSAIAEGPGVTLVNESVFKPCEVVKDYSHLKISTSSEFYDDYLPASVGMRDNVIGFSDGYYKLGFGGWTAVENVALLPEKTLLVNRILAAVMENMGSVTEIRFAVTENVPLDAKCKNGVFTITLFNTPDRAPAFAFAGNPIFKSARSSSDMAKKTVTYSFDLKDPDNWYGFEVAYEGGFIVVKVKNPMQKIEGDQPLLGLTIILDAGHGGMDPGALGFSPNKNEKDLALEVALFARRRLAMLGANVIMTRTSDQTVNIYRRMDIYNEISPDLLISLHYNSLGDAQDNLRVRGYLGLYCNDSGRLLAKACSDSISSELNRFERDPRYQALAMLRSHKFPATLCEIGFITNSSEYEIATSPEGVRRSANAIAEGVLKWIDDQQKWVN